MSATILPFPRKLRLVHPEIAEAKQRFDTTAQRHDRLLALADAMLLRATELREERRLLAPSTWPFGRKTT